MSIKNSPYNHQIFILSSTAVALIAPLFPTQVTAFWPFSDNAAAAVSVSAPHSATLALQAATNLDPNPDKGIADLAENCGDALCAHSGPSGTVADVVGQSQPDQISVYVVRPGDTLSEIAKMFNVSVNTIIWANNIQGGTVHPGETLVILPVSGVKHTVVKGDTLKSIANTYGADAGEVAQFNGLDTSSALTVGDAIIIPGGEAAVTVTIPRKVATKVVTRSKSGSEPYLGGSGAAQVGYYDNPLPGAVVTQGIHGWNGIDLGAPRGTPIHAAADGTVIVARSGGWNGGYGSYVVVSHPNGTQTLYGHMSSVVAYAGETVGSGQVIGYVGNTGKSTGNHLHFEVRGAANPFRNCSIGSACSPQ